VPTRRLELGVGARRSLWKRKLRVLVNGRAVEKEQEQHSSK
jgi:hypothetical protein